MAKNKINDLRNHLFAQLERLNDETIAPDKMEIEIDKAKAITQVSSEIIKSAKVELDFLKETGAMKSNTSFFEGVTDNKPQLDK